MAERRDRARSDRAGSLPARAILFAALSIFSLAASSAEPTRSAAAPSAPKTLEALLQEMAALPGFCSRFEEEKTTALLDAPLSSSGRLVFSPPDHLLRRVAEPYPSEIVVTGRTVEIRSGGTTQRIDLAAEPAIRPLVESILWVLAGDRAAIERAYRPTFEVDAERWTLRLEPKEARLSALLREMRIEGIGAAPERLLVVEATGDQTTTRFLDPDTNCRLTDAERSAQFGSQAP